MNLISNLMVTRKKWSHRNFYLPLTQDANNWNWLYINSPLIFTAIVAMGLFAFILWLVF